MVIRALKSLNVPVSVVADFDILSGEETLKKIVEEAGGHWVSVRQK